MNLKKIIAGVLCILLAISVLGGCSTYPEESKEPEVEESNLAEDIIGAWDTGFGEVVFWTSGYFFMDTVDGYTESRVYEIKGDTISIYSGDEFSMYSVRVENGKLRYESERGHTYEWNALSDADRARIMGEYTQ